MNRSQLIFILVLCLFALTPLNAFGQTCEPGTLQPPIVSTGPGYNQLTITVTGTQGTSPGAPYIVYGAPHGESTFREGAWLFLSPGYSITYNTQYYGNGYSLETFKTYDFYVAARICNVWTISGIASGTTRDIDAPVLSAETGPGFEQVKLKWTAVPGADLGYVFYGQYDANVGYQTAWAGAWGQQVEFVTGIWGQGSPLAPNTGYFFYTRSKNGWREKWSNVVYVKTRDIEAPKIGARIEPNGQARVSWSAVEGAEMYNVYRITQNGNQLEHLSLLYPSGSVMSFLDTSPPVNQIIYYVVFVSRKGRVRESNLVSIRGRENLGAVCHAVGGPVNVTNGNMYLTQRDYALPSQTQSIEVERTYNSLNELTGLFGTGWTTGYDEAITLFNPYMLMLQAPDGRGVHFGRSSTNQPFRAVVGDVHAEVVQNADSSFDLKFQDGRVHHFDSAGNLQWLRDRNSNQTTLSYNGSGVLSSVTDAGGRTLVFTPNTNGTISQISDSIGVIADYEYLTGTTLLKTVTYPDGSKYKFEYETVGTNTLLKTVKDALDNVLETHDYDSQGRATTSERHGGAEKYTLDYSNWGATEPFTKVTDALGRETKYYFDTSHGRNVVSKTEGICGCGGSGSETTQFVYDHRINLVKKIDALTRETTYTYDDIGNRLSETDVLGTHRWTYNSFGQVLTYQDRVDSGGTNNTAVLTYDANGNLLTSTNALNKTTTLTYTTGGQLATVTDARSKTTTLTYDTQGRLTQITDANNKNTNFGYDARARLTSTTNALSQTNSFEYDLNNRLKKVIHPDSNFVTYTYDLAGRRTGVTDERNNTTNFDYDNAYRLTSVTDPLSHATTYGYDLMSNMTSQTDALGNTTNLEYDDFNRLKKVIYPPATTGGSRLEESMTYDQMGNVKTRVDTAGRTTAYDYDTSNRLIKITDALMNPTQFEYNLRSQRTKVKDALNQEYIFTYDPLGRVLTQTRAGTTMSFEYDNVGNRTKRTDYLGRVTDYQYDNLNRLTSILYASTVDTTYTYDDLSRLLTAVNGSGTVSFTYDNRSRLKTETDVFGHVIEYGYDAAGNRTQLKLDSAVQTAYSYDAANRLTTLTDDASQNFTYGYDIANRLISKAMPNGITTTYEYDGMSRLKRLKDVNSSTTLFDRQYSYNTANQISQIAELSQTRNFTYDNLDRLTGVTNGTSNESYSYDAVGNRTSSHLSATYTINPFNRLSATVGSTMSYDSNGNMTGKTVGSVNWTYGWDFENRMTSASDGAETAAYVYDALGRRVKRTKGTDIIKFTHDGQDVGLDDQNSVITKYQNGPGIDNKLSVKNGSSFNYFLTNHLGSSNGLADQIGTITSSAAYDSFGSQTGTLGTRYGFTGRERDDFTGLMYYRARMYDPTVGRFISEDPIGFAGGDVNLYGYVRNKPVNFFDPFGLDEYAMMERLGNQQPSNRTLSEALDELQLMLGVLGMAPGVGEPFDAVDTAISAVRGEYCDAALGAGSMAPYAGWGAGVTKIYRRLDKLKPTKYLTSRPPYRAGQVDEVWDAAKNADGRVFDPYSGAELFWDKSRPRNGQWDMGHREEIPYRKYSEQYKNGEISLDEFKRIHRDSKNYQPQSVQTNRGWRRR